jgi:acyl dehydratase
MATTIPYAELAEARDVDLGTSDWLEVTQQMVDLFADATLDHQWIHVDHEKAAAGPFGGTIAHGFLTLSLLPHLVGDLLVVPETTMGVNYGLDKLRLTAPVPVGSRVRARGRLADCEVRGPGVMCRIDVTIEIEGAEKPALVCTWVVLRYA